jgi:hypothetical protein
MDKSDRVAQAIAINGDRIVAVGSNAEIGKPADARTNVVNVGGRTFPASSTATSTLFVVGRPTNSKPIGMT